MAFENPNTSPSDADSAAGDLGPLAWVLDELRKSLDSATKSLKRFVRDADAARGSDLATIDTSALRVARQQIHSSVGALDMVGLAGPALVVRSMESAVQKFVQQPEKCNEDAASKVERTSFALIQYLEACVAGKQVSAVALFPQFKSLQELLSVDRVHPSDLWDFDQHASYPQLEFQATPIEPNAALRAELDRCVLQIVKSSDLPSALVLRDRFVSLHAGAQGELKASWGVTAAFFEALGLGLLAPDLYVKRMPSRILGQYNQVAKGELGSMDVLLRDLLFFCSQAIPGSTVALDACPILSAVRTAYRLGRYRVVDYTIGQFGNFDPSVLVQARKRVTAAKELWSNLAGGDVNKGKITQDQFSLVVDSLNKLHPASQVLSAALVRAVETATTGSKAPSTELAMEVATAVLYLEAAFEDLDPNDPELVNRTNRLAHRLESVRAGAGNEPLEPWIEELYRRVSDRQTMGSVVGELRVSLNELERVLDQFFRDPAEKTLLQPVPGQLSQMRGVLTVLGLNDASLAVIHMRERVEEILVTDIDPQKARETGTFDKLGNNLGALGFLIDMLGYQPAFAKKLFAFDPVKGELRPLMGRSEPRVIAGEAGDFRQTIKVAQSARPFDTISAESTQAAPLPQSAQASLHAGIAPALLAATAALASQAGQLNAGSASAGSKSAGKPSSKPAPVIADDEFGDEDLRDIFLEEAREVVHTGTEALDALVGDPSNLADQTTLRRAFHTLKGSSRMVGLNEFGEAAWSMEQVFNAWLADQKPVSADLMDLSRQAIAHFATWVDAIAADAADAFKFAPVRASADAMRLNHVLVPIERIAFVAPVAVEPVAVEPAAVEQVAVEQVAVEPFVEVSALAAAADSSSAAAMAPAVLDTPELRGEIELPVASTELVGDAPADFLIDAKPETETVAAQPAGDLSVGAIDFDLHHGAPEAPRGVSIADEHEQMPAFTTSEIASLEGFELPAIEPVDLGPMADLNFDPSPGTTGGAFGVVDSQTHAAAGLGVQTFTHQVDDRLSTVSVNGGVDAFSGPVFAATALGDDALPELGNPGDDLDAMLEDFELGVDAGASKAPIAEIYGGRIAALPHALLPHADSAEAALTDSELTDAELAAFFLPETPTQADPTPIGLVVESNAVTAATSISAAAPVAGAALAAGLVGTFTQNSQPVAESPVGLPPDATVASASTAEVVLDEFAQDFEIDLEDFVLAEMPSPAAQVAPSVMTQATLGTANTPENTLPLADGQSNDAQQSLPNAALATGELASVGAVAGLMSKSALSEPGVAVRPSFEPHALSDVASYADPADEQVRVIGPLRISIPLYNVYLNEADEWSRKLLDEVGVWRMDAAAPISDAMITWAHSLGGSSATVGFSGLSEVARGLEHALHSAQLADVKAAHQCAVLFDDAANDIRRLLHQFAAGFLKEPRADVVEQLKHFHIDVADPDPSASSQLDEQGLDGQSLDERFFSSSGMAELEAFELAAEPVEAPVPVAIDDPVQIHAVTAEPQSIDKPMLVEPASASASLEVRSPEVVLAVAPLIEMPTEMPVEPPVPAPIEASLPVATVTALGLAAMAAGAVASSETSGHVLPLVVADVTASAASVAAPVVAPRDAAAVAQVHDIDDEIDAVDAVDADLFPIFEEEAQELMPTLAGALRQWHARVDNLSARGEVLRALHTLKGSARLAGAMRVGEMAHQMESEIERFHAPSAHDVEPLIGQFDAMQLAFETLRKSDQTAYILAGGLGLLGASTAAVASASDAPVLNAGSDLAITGALAPAAKLFAPVNPTALAAPIRSAASTHTVRVRSQLLDRMLNQTGEVMITRSRLEAELSQLRGSLGDLTANLDRMRQQLREIELQAETQMQSRQQLAKAADVSFDPLEFDRFTRFQEITRSMAESVNDVATVQRNIMRAVEATEDDLIAQARQTRELQRDLLKTRMVEFEGISERLYRVVRQAGKDSGKQVKLDIIGGSIELDRGVLDRMTPAFEHLLRNCVAHGIESLEARGLAGKEGSGNIVISLHQEGNEVAVEFADDGAGLNLAKIRSKALAQGLITNDAAITEADAATLIFMPGFSTADQVSELSGRGIGMDIVRNEVQALGGRVETKTQAGQGTSFKMVLPLTTAVTQVVMLRAGKLSIGVPSNVVEVVRRATPKELELAYNSGIYEYAGESLPFFWSGALLQSSARSTEPQGRSIPVVVFRSAQQRVAMHVDEVLGNQEVVVKNLGAQLSRLPGLAGMSVLASGAVVLIYNPVALASVYGAQARTLSADRAQPNVLEAIAKPVAPAQMEPTLDASGEQGHGFSVPKPTRPNVEVPLVMVVDDSITVRRVTQRLLAREGYRVVLAADGLQALEKLQDEIPAVVLSDIEMPRMDGFDLARNIRMDNDFFNIPIIMITSRIAEKHKEHAAELGVNHYLGKPYNEDELLSLVRRYCFDEQPA